MEMYKSPRRFITYDFSSSHSRLLFRCLKDDKNENNIDIIFYAVDYMQIPNSFRGIIINKITDSEQIKRILMQHNQTDDPQISVFELISESKTFYVFSDSCRGYFNKLDFQQSSLYGTDFLEASNMIFNSKEVLL